LILVSSVLVWDGTPRKIKPPPEEKKEENPDEVAPETTEENKTTVQVQNSDEESESDDEKPVEPVPVPDQIQEIPGEEEEKPPEYLPFQEGDYKMRQPYGKYQNLKDLEDLVLSLEIENVKVYVVCAGILYGAGELGFKNMIKVY
jgi:adenylate kinase